MIELSADLGEGSPREDEIWPLIGAANVACGGHVGDDRSMREAVRFAATHGVVLGAHPSYPDRENFGRRSLDLGTQALRETLVEQLCRLRALAGEAGVVLRRVKPHGALYNDAHRDPERAEAIVSAILETDPSLALVSGDSSAMATAARAAGVAVIREAFADRRYEADGSLVARSLPGALLSVSEAADQAVRLAGERTAPARDGSFVRIEFDTLCIHADMESAVERLLAIRAALRVRAC